MLRKLTLTAIAASALAISPAAAYDGDTFAAKFEALPQPVKDTAKANMGSALPVSIAAAKNDQGWDYQINTRLNGKYHDLVIDKSGKLIAVKDETDLAALPAPAKAALEKQAASAKLLSLEKITEGTKTTFGAVMKDEAQGTFIQLRVNPDGTVNK